MQIRVMVLVYRIFLHRDLSTSEVKYRYLLYFCVILREIFGRTNERMDGMEGQSGGYNALPLGCIKN